MALEANGLDTVRGEVRKVLQRSAAFQALAPEDRRRFANDVVRIGAFLSEDPGWLESSQAKSVGLAEPVEDLKGRLAKKSEFAGKEFEAGAVKQGVEQFGELVQKVDFPAFVSGLIQGVFQSIVDASMQQMKAYADLMAAAAKSVEQFASDHITDAQARDYARNRYPSMLRLDVTDDGGRKLAVSDSVEDTAELAKMTGGQAVDLSSDEGEQAFVNAAKLEMARSRQQTMALMVLLGINRIVVTNGRINAKVVFDMRASDQAKRHAEAELNDRSETSTFAAATYIAPWGGGGGGTSTNHVATVSSAVDDTSESKAQVKAQLSGDVRVNFKSETFPLERMLDQGQIDQLSNIAKPGRGALPPAQPTPTVPAPAPAAPAAPTAPAAPAPGART